MNKVPRSVSWLLAVITIVALMPSVPVDAKPKQGSRECSMADPTSVQTIVEEMAASPDGGEALFNFGLTKACEQAVIEGMTVTTFETEESADEPVYESILESDASGQLSSDGQVSTQSVPCQTKTVTVTGKTMLEFVAWRWKLHKYWCPLADNWRINGDPQWWTSVSDLNQHYYRGVSTNANFWEYWPTQHYTYAQGVLENCVFKYGCIGSSWPWAWIRVYGNTTWAGTGSGQ